MGFHFLSPLTMGSHLDILMGSRFPASLPPAHQELSFALGLPSCIDLHLGLQEAVLKEKVFWGWKVQGCAPVPNLANLLCDHGQVSFPCPPPASVSSPVK